MLEVQSVSGDVVDLVQQRKCPLVTGSKMHVLQGVRKNFAKSRDRFEPIDTGAFVIVFKSRLNNFFIREGRIHENDIMWLS